MRDIAATHQGGSDWLVVLCVGRQRGETEDLVDLRMKLRVDRAMLIRFSNCPKYHEREGFSRYNVISDRYFLADAVLVGLKGKRRTVAYSAHALQHPRWLLYWAGRHPPSKPVWHQICAENRLAACLAVSFLWRSNLSKSEQLRVLLEDRGRRHAADTSTFSSRSFFRLVLVLSYESQPQY